MILIKSLLTRVLYDCFKLIYAYLNEGDKVRECYSCLKMLGFLQYFSLNVHYYLNDYFCVWNCWNQAQFLNKKLIMKCLAIKITASNFYNSQFKKYNCNSTHSYNRKIWVNIPSYIVFPCMEVQLLADNY